jgi:hypothetical protein
VQLHHKKEKKKKKEPWAYFAQKACSTGQAFVAELNWAPKAYPQVL